MGALTLAGLSKFKLAVISCTLLLFYCATAMLAPAQTLSTLADFDGADGFNAVASVLQASDGNFYGTTLYGGPSNQGIVYKVTPSGTLTKLHAFCSLTGCADGFLPYGGLLKASDGNFYGTTSRGGPGLFGSIYQMTSSGTVTTIYTFCPTKSCTDGSYPHATLIQGADGNFYGTTLQGGNLSCNGSNGCGTIFKVTPSGTLTTLYNFCSQSNCADGQYPYSGLVKGTDGNFYGVAAFGGIVNSNCLSGCGTIFKITPSGTFTLLHSFTFADGSKPWGALIQASDKNFYGTTAGGGNSSCSTGCGTIFKMTAAGALTSLYSFCGQTNCPDGNWPLAGLVQATDGNLYGTAEVGGTSNGGTIFQITPSGAFTTVYKFCSQSNCTDGASPEAALIQASDGNLYGTTANGGANQKGNVFRLGLSVPPTAGQFVPVTPCRVVDTRQTHDPILGGTAQSFVVPQLGGCNIPATAAAYSLNVTAAPQQHIDYLTIWPTGQPQPVVSTMNSPDGRTKANAAIVPAGTNGAVSVYSTNTTDVILDINGYFTAPGSGTYQFYQLAPCRLVDTRNGHNSGTLTAGTERDYTIAGHCGIPTTATAYSFNVTVVPNNGALDYLTVWPKGVSRPTVSTLNDPTGTVVANAAIVPAGAHQATAFYPNNNSTDLLVDVNGYFAPAGSGGLSLYPVTPCRVLDTRGVGSGQPFQGVYNSPNGIDVVTSPCAPPDTSKAFVFNATVAPPGPMSYLTLWPHNETQPNVSTLNASDGSVTSNMAIVPTDDGSIDAYAAGLTQLILDISGYFAP